MRWRELFARRPDAEFPARVSPPELVQHVPLDATYVTFGEVMALTDAVAYNGGPAGAGGGHGRAPSWRPGPTDGPRIQGLLVLTPGELTVISTAGVVHVIPLENLAALDAGRPIGFVLFYADGSGLEVGQHVPVRAQAPATFATAGRVTNQFAGWDAQLAPRGIEVHW